MIEQTAVFCPKRGFYISCLRYKLLLLLWWLFECTWIFGSNLIFLLRCNNNSRSSSFVSSACFANCFINLLTNWSFILIFILNAYCYQIWYCCNLLIYKLRCLKLSSIEHNSWWSLRWILTMLLAWWRLIRPMLINLLPIAITILISLSLRIIRTTTIILFSRTSLLLFLVTISLTALLFLSILYFGRRTFLITYLTRIY